MGQVKACWIEKRGNEEIWVDEDGNIGIIQGNDRRPGHAYWIEVNKDNSRQTRLI